MAETPYYLLTRRCFWKKVKAGEFPAAGAKVSYASEAGIGGAISFAEERGEKWTRRSEVERYETETGRHTAKYEDGERVLIVVRALVNRYTLTRTNRDDRTNGDVIGEIEFIEKDNSISRSYSEHETSADAPETGGGRPDGP